MGPKYYTCQYCYEDYIPKRRNIQRFCSTSCRVKSHHQKTKTNTKLLVLQETDKQKTSIEKMSFAGVGNAAVGSLAADALKSIFIKEENKPATKADLKNLENKFARYQLIHNLPKNNLGLSPYYDNQERIVIYLNLW
jgi:hypothetical protein